jgi:hypothetical protein
MRLKFEKGFTPEKIAKHLIRFVEENDIDFASVNIYIQVYKEDGTLEDFKHDSEFLVFSPGEETKSVAAERSVKLRRSRIKLVDNKPSSEDEIAL